MLTPLTVVAVAASDIQYLLPGVVTVQYLEQKYIDIYNLRFNTIGDDGCNVVLNSRLLLDLMRVYSIDLTMYLRDSGVDVTKVKVIVYGYLAAVIIDLELYGKYHVMVECLGLQRSEPPCVKYGVMPGKYYNVQGTANLIASMQASLGYYDCAPCHYSDASASYCGLGLGMYTMNCSSRKIHPQCIAEVIT